MEMLAKLIQPLKASSPIEINPSGNDILINSSNNENPCSAIATTGIPL
jgi:hypothetical protein